MNSEKHLFWEIVMVLMLLIPAAREDVRRRRLPPLISWLLALASLPRVLWTPRAWLMSLGLALFSSLLLLILAWSLGNLLKGRVLGGGDIKLLFCLQLHFSPRRCLLFWVLFALLALATALADRRREIPLGPAILGAALGAFLF